MVLETRKLGGIGFSVSKRSNNDRRSNQVQDEKVLQEFLPMEDKGGGFVVSK